MERLSIIIPAYNEEKRIGKTLESYGKFFQRVVKEKKLGSFEILVVINNTHDKTEEVVRFWQKKFGELRFLNLKQGGKGFALVEGFTDALTRDNTLIGFADADMATKPPAFYELVKNIGNFDGILASRWKKGAKNMNYLLKRKITSRGFNFLTRAILFLPFSDTQCGAKVFRRNSISQVVGEIGTTRWNFDVDMLYRMVRKGLRIKELPTVWEDKEGSKISLAKVPLQMFSGLMRLRLLFSPFKFIVDLYDKLPERLKLHH